MKNKERLLIENLLEESTIKYLKANPIRYSIIQIITPLGYGSVSKI